MEEVQQDLFVDFMFVQADGRSTRLTYANARIVGNSIIADTAIARQSVVMLIADNCSVFIENIHQVKPDAREQD